MPFHFHLPHFHIHHKRRHAVRTASRFTDVETGRRNITAPTHVRRLDDVINDTAPYDFQRSDSTEALKTNRLLPIFSGIMISFSIMLSIPSLIGEWYIRTEGDVTKEIRPNPVLLDVALGFSITCAVLASAFLIVRFAERCVKQMTLASIAFLTLHDLINIPVVIVFGVIHRFDDGFTFGQSYWFTICSTVVSTTTNITLIIDYVTTKDFANSGSGLTSKQRSLVIIAMVLLFYISFGSFIEAKLLNIPFLSALYFSVVSIETIGFGDIYPKTTGARVFTCFYIVGGIMNIALAVTIARDVVLESAVIEFQQRMAVQKHERRLRSRWRAAVRWRLRERGLPVWVHHHRQGLPEEHPHHHRWYDRLSRLCESLSRFVFSNQEDPAWKFQYGPRQKRLNIEALSDADLNAAALETGAPLSTLVPEELRRRRQESATRPPGVPLSNRPTIENGHGLSTPHSLTHFRLAGMLAILGNFAMAVSQVTVSDSDSRQDSTDSNYGTASQPEASSTTVEERPPEEALNLPRHGVPLTITATIHEDDHQTEASLEKDAKMMLNVRLLIAASLFLAFWLIGSVLFMRTERWTFWAAAYFCFIAFTTVGYGDFSPKSPAGLSIFVVWALLGVATMTILVSVIMESFSQRYQHAIRSEVFKESSTTPTSRPPLSEHPTFASGADQGFFLPSTAQYLRAARGEMVPHVNGGSTPRIRIQESTPVESTPSKELQAMNDSRSPQSVPMQVDHLKSLITMARAQSELEENDTCHLENLISYLEKTLLDVEVECSDEKLDEK